MGVFDSAAALVRKLPAGELPARAIELYGRGFAAVEGAGLRLLWSRLDAQVPESRQLAGPAPRHPETPQAPPTMMSTLLSRSLEQNATTGREEYHRAVLRQLTPDEARIIAALADRPPAPLVTVLRRSGGDKLLENASLIGRTAAVTLPSMTPTYVSHLFDLGLVEAGPEDEENPRGYELVLAEKEVRAALKDGEFGKLPARVQRRTLRLSAHGRELWEATRPDGER
jgi:hypothetical protein